MYLYVHLYKHSRWIPRGIIQFYYTLFCTYNSVIISYEWSEVYTFMLGLISKCNCCNHKKRNTILTQQHTANSLLIVDMFLIWTFTYSYFCQLMRRESVCASQYLTHCGWSKSNLAWFREWIFPIMTLSVNVKFLTFSWCLRSRAICSPFASMLATNSSRSRSRSSRNLTSVASSICRLSSWCSLQSASETIRYS